MFKLRFIGDPILRRKTSEIETFDSSLKKFVEKMFETMHLEEGIGLAAPQVGHSRKILVVDISGIEDQAENKPRAFINPIIDVKWGESVIEEGCLSIPDVREEVTRPSGIKIRYQDENGENYEDEYEGWMARVLQHEVDHLNGILFLDHISPLKRKLLQEKKLIPDKY
jgi:peptide deformylase